MIDSTEKVIADIVFLNGEVITIDDHQTITEAIAIKDNKICSVGSSVRITDFIGENTKIIDLKGRSLLPGFIDSHIHLSIYGTNLLDINCNSPEVQSLEDLYTELRKEVQHVEKGNWIRASGFNENNIVEKRLPTKRELDAISTEHPILIVRVCNHQSIVNSRALKIANIDEKTKNPEGGIIEKDASGHLTGKLIENAHMKISEVASHHEEELKKSMKMASEVFIKHGITSIHDAGGYGDGSKLLEIMQEGTESGDIKLRIYAMIGSLIDSKKFIKEMKEKNIVTGFGNEKFKVGPVKLFSDGSSTGPTLATRKPYTNDPNDFGILYDNQKGINQVLIDAHKRGYQITAHAQGDRAIEMVLNCIEAALNERPKANHRHRIEHAGIAPPDLQKRMKELNVIVIPNPVFMYENGDHYIHFYGDRVNWMYPANDYIESTITAAFGSDAPVVGCDPLLGIHAAVNRKSKHNIQVGERQKIGVLDALKAYTIMGAYASFEEEIKGSLEKGKLADLVVLDKSILNVEKEKIKELQVELTMINGEIVYRSN
ncbi:amidohydrolase [Pseudogracilibacillus auburnensis]|uniref:Amidohydrolase 3 domain-containing protein n=1 Tax=Pseudogracilibacillus auburnensis TaxID=1494959 RepID=A0A2V3W128_9BACI|nr:amidohydrolase [Pseudogracilibacillus auburnensis]MBO1002152.1 amidohydrolase [Pseudogracilibacillus auburnensis]PXW87476.1 hypothetical protein DFR56_105118 [Pseudogracilibacillus auburnensis]